MLTGNLLLDVILALVIFISIYFSVSLAQHTKSTFGFKGVPLVNEKDSPTRVALSIFSIIVFVVTINFYHQQEERAKDAHLIVYDFECYKQDTSPHHYTFLVRREFTVDPVEESATLFISGVFKRKGEFGSEEVEKQLPIEFDENDETIIEEFGIKLGLPEGSEISAISASVVFKSMQSPGESVQCQVRSE